jgi:predicted HTH domain antitoxin
MRNLTEEGKFPIHAKPIHIWDFLELLRERKVPIHYDLKEYEEDLKTIQELS